LTTLSFPQLLPTPNVTQASEADENSEDVEDDEEDDPETMIGSDLPDSLHPLMPVLARNLCSSAEGDWSRIALATSTVLMAKLAVSETSNIDDSMSTEVGNLVQNASLCERVETVSKLPVDLNCRFWKACRSSYRKLSKLQSQRTGVRSLLFNNKTPSTIRQVATVLEGVVIWYYVTVHA
jgi:hypothetical protein